MKKLAALFTGLFSGESTINFVNRSSDMLLALWIIAVIVMIVLPVPAPVIDLLITFNLTAAIALLMVALYIPNALQLSMFPSLLLVTTLFRLGVTISSTRQILLKAYAGHVISAFGNFVVGGNYVVGLIIFLIITIVQFIVVTKGAERVAEVAARFRLDAMPGKQMAIDADLRSGILDSNQAREKRALIQKESELYGAMDGAMKFVKGDVIAGIIIAFVNIVGGLIIGVLMHKMTLGQSAKIYTLLSIGDGLVSQIPSLLISLTAGIVTTRVSSDRKDANLGKEIASQIFKEPKAMMIAAGAIFCIGFFKGFPLWSFALLAFGLATIGIALWRRKKKEQTRQNAMERGGAIETDVEGHTIVGGAEEFTLTLPVVLELGKYLSQVIIKSKGPNRFIEQMIPQLRVALYQDLGIRFPGIHVNTDSSDIEIDQYRIYLHEVPVVQGKVLENQFLVNENQKSLHRYNLPFTSYRLANDLPDLWVSTEYKNILDKAGIKYWDATQVLILHLSSFFKNNAAEFFGIQETRSVLEFAERTFPDLVKEATRLIPLQKLTEIFRRLVQEQISIKDIRTILEALSEWAQTEKDTVLLTEYVRSSLRRYISYKYSQGRSTLAVYLIDPEIEELVRGAIKQTSAGSYLALDPDTTNLIMKSMRNTVQPAAPGGQPPVLLTAIDVRRFVRKLIESEFPEIPVLSYQEIIPEVRIQSLGRIQLG